MTVAGDDSGTWLDSLRVEVRRFRGNQDVFWSVANNQVKEVQARLEKLGAQAESNATARQEAERRQLAARVQNLVMSGAFGALSNRELRIAASMLRVIPPPVFQHLAAARPEILSPLVDSFFESWTELDGSDARDDLVRIIARAPEGVRVLHRGIRTYDILGRNGAGAVVETAQRDLNDLVEYLTKHLRCRRYWSFFHEVLAEWIVHALTRLGLPRVWGELNARRDIAEALLPELRSTTGKVSESWFGGPRATGSGTAPLRVRARVVASLLKACLASNRPPSPTIQEQLLRSAFGDPRMPPLSQGWRAVQALDSGTFKAFIAQLVKEDLSLFFRHAMDEKDREEFWLRYLDTIRGTLTVLAPERHDILTAQLGATDEGRAVLGRARRARHGTVSAFCLFFERIVVVEFSETGNAAYLYDRRQFEELIGPTLGDISSVARALKRKELGPERVTHRGDWEDRAHDLLMDYGVVPSARARW